MKRILYLMHVDWSWIKQRPHFLAERLAKYYKVSVWHEHSFHTKQLVKNDINVHENLSINNIKRLPLARFGVIQKINQVISRFLLRHDYKSADIIWITSPLYRSFFKKRQKLLVYDCMDDFLEFNFPKIIKNAIKKNEELLIKEANVIISASEHLKKTLIKRYGNSNQIHVVNNAIFLNENNKNTALPESIQQYFIDKSFFKIVYIGTVSSWFDIDLLHSSLKENENIQYLIFGPCEQSLKSHPRLKLLGPVEHKYIYAIMEQADCLVMPFIVNELIKSVNPVKAYEYIYACKPVLIPYYGETEKFSPYCYLYHSSHEYFSLIYDLVKGKIGMLGMCEEHRNFARINTWEFRIEEIHNILAQNC